jgi:hypothetical protein
MKTYNRTPIWIGEQLGDKLNVEPVLELLTKNHAEEYAGYVDEAIKWVLSAGIESGIDLMSEAYNLCDIRDMFLEMVQSSK